MHLEKKVSITIFTEFEIDDENQDNLAEIEDVALNSDAYTVIEKPTPSDST